MTENLNILIVSYSPWNNQTNDGNTLNNLFRNIEANFSNIYFSEGLPSNDKCVNYFQYTDKMIIDHLLKFRKIGNRFNAESANYVHVSQFEDVGKQHKSELLLLMREVAWSCVNLINDELREFINDVSPDIVFFPTYGSLRILNFDLKLKKICNVPFVGFISDDLYSYKTGQGVLSRLNQFLLRRKLYKVFNSYDLIYTMTKEQKEQIKFLFNRDSKILRKSVYRLGNLQLSNYPLKFTYAGGLYFGRFQILQELAKILKKLSDEKGYTIGYINIYSFDRPKEMISDDFLIFHDGVNYETLLDIYDYSDVALVVESFEKRFIDITKLSFSTKILDCLQSGCAILAISPLENAGVNYLKEEKAAVVVNDITQIEKGVLELIENYELYQNRARECVLSNHDSFSNTKLILDDFYNLVNSTK